MCHMALPKECVMCASDLPWPLLPWNCKHERLESDSPKPSYALACVRIFAPYTCVCVCACVCILICAAVLAAATQK